MITFNIPKARGQANTIEDIAGRIERLANQDFNNAIQGLSGCWKGAAADRYYNKAGKLKGKLISDAKELRATTSTIRFAVRKAEWAEETAKRIASFRLW